MIRSYKNIIFDNTFTLERVNFIHNRMKTYRNLQKKLFRELIEKTWHPKRFFDWCLTIEEKKDIKE